MENKRFELRLVVNMAANQAPKNRSEKDGWNHDTINKAVRKVVGHYDRYDDVVRTISKRWSDKATSHGIMKYEMIDHKLNLLIKFRWYNEGGYRILDAEMSE